MPTDASARRQVSTLLATREPQVATPRAIAMTPASLTQDSRRVMADLLGWPA